MVSAAVLVLACNQVPELPGLEPRPVRGAGTPEQPLGVDEIERVADEPRFVEGDPVAPIPVTVGFSGEGVYVLPGHPDALVLLLNDAETGALHLLQPNSNARNRWEFELPGERLGPSDPRLAQLIKVPHEGYYRLTRELRFKDGGRWLTGAIVQLGYDAQGRPILFIAQRRKEEQNVLFFSDQGVRIARDQLQWLEPLAWYEESKAAPAE
jgi:hypothetical protein